MNANPSNVLIVGQCDFDHGNISRMLQEVFRATTSRAATAKETFKAVRADRFDLVLVNRILDADGTEGLDLIAKLKSDAETRSTPVALVSNYADAQDAAVAIGAERGFGKDALTSPATRDRLAALLGG